MSEGNDNKTNPEFKETLSRLRKPVPEKLIKQRSQGGATLDYIEWTTAYDVLDEKVGRYSVDIGKVLQLGEYVMVEVGITIDGERRANVGSEKLSHKGFGDPFTNAYAQAFKRAAASWGIARTLYQDEDAQTLIRDNDLKVRDLVVKLVDVATRKGYSDEKLTAALERNYKEPNPYNLTVKQLQDAITKLSKLPDVEVETAKEVAA